MVPQQSDILYHQVIERVGDLEKNDIKISERVDDLEKNDGKLLAELASVNGKLDVVLELLEERPSRIEMKLHDKMTQDKVDSLRAKHAEVATFSDSQKHFLKLGALVVGAIGGLEIWLKVRSIIFSLLGIN